MPSNYDIAFNMFKKRAEDILARYGYDVKANGMSRMIWSKMLDRLEPKVKPHIEELIADPPGSIDLKIAEARKVFDEKMIELAEELKKQLHKNI